MLNITEYNNLPKELQNVVVEMDMAENMLEQYKEAILRLSGETYFDVLEVMLDRYAEECGDWRAAREVLKQSGADEQEIWAMQASYREQERAKKKAV